MCDSKSNIRSFRFSDRVLEILEGFAGNSLNDKFNNLVLFCYDEVPKQHKILESVKNEIVAKRNKSHDLTKKLADIDLLIKDLQSIKFYGEIAVRRSKTITEEL